VLRIPREGAEDGEAALQYLFGTSTSTLPSLILMDLNVAKLSGLEILQQLRSDERTRRRLSYPSKVQNDQRDVAVAYDLGANS
jgi:two-component system response regulator